jgi:hypothetical protein
MKSLYLKIVFSILLVFSITFSHTHTLDNLAQKNIDSSLKRALLSFGSAMALNTVISVMQGTEISIEPMGVGMTFTPGETLDPINDLIERFSMVMLASSTAIGIQKIFLQISSWPLFSGLYTGVFGLTLVCFWLPALPVKVKSALFKASIILMFLRFSVPMVFIANEMTCNGFLNSGYDESIKILDNTRSDLQQIQRQVPQVISNKSPVEDETGKSNWEKMLEEPVKKLKEQVNLIDYVATQVSGVKLSISQQMNHLEKVTSEVTSKMISNIINLIVVFTLQTVVFPMLFLYGLYHLLIFLLGLNIADYLSDKEQ